MALVKVDDVVSAGAIPVMDRLNQCVAAADQVIAFARTSEGAVRNSKLLLSASEHLRRCLETAARVTETMMRAERVERFHAVIIEEIGKERRWWRSAWRCGLPSSRRNGRPGRDREGWPFIPLTWTSDTIL